MIPVSYRVHIAALALGFAVAVLPGVARAQGTTSERILAASSLPRLASDLRDAGALPEEVTMALEQLRAAQVSPVDAARVMKAEYEARHKDRSPSVEFGVLVRDALQKGVRGPALADAIRTARAAKPVVKRKVQ